MNHEAIYNTHPSVVRINDSLGAFDVDGNPVTLDQAKVDAEVARLQAEYDALAYSRTRADAYAEVKEQLDLLYHDMVADKGDKTGTWFAAIKAVKDANPKPE